MARAELATMIGQLAHRGPDELVAGLPEPWVGLAHARLRVIDLSDAARQPMVGEDGAVWVVYNGEIYNFRELREELAGRGHRCVSQSDTEVVLRAYEAWGVEAFRRLDGMFALAIWDGRRRELVLARDRVGKKPLFYWTDGHCVAFASEIKALFRHQHVPRRFDETVLPFLLAFGYPPTGHTCYEQIRQVPPATVLRFRRGAPMPDQAAYWQLTLAPSRAGVSSEEAARDVRQLLTAAVRRRLVADVPLGAFLSGGIDSTIIVGLMAEAMGDRPVKTFSIGFEGDARFDETPYAKLAADRFRTEHTVFTVTPQAFDLLETLVWHHDQPFGDSSAVPVYLLAELTRRQVTVALTGDGGDEVFAGYERFLAACWAERMPAWVLAWAAALLRTASPGHARTFLARAKRFVTVARLPLPERFLQWSAYVGEPAGWMREPWRLASGNGISTLHPSLAAWWDASQGWSVLSRLLCVNLKEYLANDLLVKTDRCSMAHGLEARSPFLDTALMEYVAGLPDAYKARGWTTKVLLKRACADLLPPAIRRRGKMGFGVPLGTWFRRQWRDPMRDLLLPSTARVCRYLREDRIHEIIARHLQGAEDAGQRLWLLLTIEVWLRQLERSLPPVVPRDVVWVGPDQGVVERRAAERIVASLRSWRDG